MLSVFRWRCESLINGELQLGVLRFSLWMVQTLEMNAKNHANVDLAVAF